MENVNDELRIKNTELQAEVNKWKHNSQYFDDESAERLSKITELQAQLEKYKASNELMCGFIGWVAACGQTIPATQHKGYVVNIISNAKSLLKELKGEE